MTEPTTYYGEKPVYDPQDRPPDIAEEAELAKKDVIDHIDDKASEYAEEIGVDFWTAFQTIFEVMHDWVIDDFDRPEDVGEVIKQNLREMSDHEKTED